MSEENSGATNSQGGHVEEKLKPFHINWLLFLIVSVTCIFIRQLIWWVSIYTWDIFCPFCMIITPIISTQRNMLTNLPNSSDGLYNKTKYRIHKKTKTQMGRESTQNLCVVSTVADNCIPYLMTSAQINDFVGCAKQGSQCSEKDGIPNFDSIFRAAPYNLLSK